ncbi:hypothetical protein LINPERPRIM_LOCUS29940 [Linum perenne]
MLLVPTWARALLQERSSVRQWKA